MDPFGFCFVKTFTATMKGGNAAGDTVLDRFSQEAKRVGRSNEGYHIGKTTGLLQLRNSLMPICKYFLEAVKMRYIEEVDEMYD